MHGGNGDMRGVDPGDSRHRTFGQQRDGQRLGIDRSRKLRDIAQGFSRNRAASGSPCAASLRTSGETKSSKRSRHPAHHSRVVS